MIQGSFTQQSIRDGSCVMYHDYRLGHAQDLSSYGNHGTVISPSQFQRNGIFIAGMGGGGVTVAGSASINISTFTSVSFFVDGNSPSTKSNLCQLARKQDAGGLCWSIRAAKTGTGLTTQIDSSTSATWSASRSHDGVRCYGCNIQSGTANTPCYYDGQLIDSALNVSHTITNIQAVSMTIGNIYLANRGIGACYSAYMLFNRLLTATEHARLYGELMK